jgi:hypothetical protein
MSEIEKINNDLVVDDMVYRPTSTLSNQNIEGHLCINYNDKILEFNDKDCANYVYNLRKLLKESRFLLSKTPYENMSQYLTFTDVIKRIDKILGEVDR